MQSGCDRARDKSTRKSVSDGNISASSLLEQRPDCHCDELEKSRVARSVHRREAGVRLDAVELQEGR